MHTPLPALSLCLLLIAVGCNSGGSSGSAPPTAENTLLDVDRDGFPDEVWVSDWDGDGTLETQDVQQAIDALRAAGPARRMTIVVAGSGAFRAPTTSPWYQSNGLIALPSHTHLRCLPDAVLEGMAPSAYTGNGDDNSAVIANADATTSGNVDITVEGCTIHGGKDAPYTRLPGGPSHKFDPAIAMMGADDVRILNNTEYCGGYLRNVPGNFPGYYLFVTDSPNAAPSPWAGGNVTSHVRIEANSCFRVSGACFNTRHNTIGTMEHIDWVNNASSECGSIAKLDGIVNGSFTGHRADGDADGLSVAQGASSFQRDQANKASVRNFRIEDVEILELTGRHAALSLGGFGEDVIVRNVRVLGTSRDMDCMNFFHPSRNLLIEDVFLSHCGRHGLATAAIATPPHEPAFAPLLRDVSISCVDASNPFDEKWRDGWVLRAPLNGMRTERLSIDGVSRGAVRVVSGWEGDGLPEFGLVDQTWIDTTLDLTPCGYDGAYPESVASARACEPERSGAWMRTTDAMFDGECDFRDGGGSADSACRCGIAYSGLADVGSGNASLAVSDTTFEEDELVRSHATLVLRPEEESEERCSIAFHDADSITCTTEWAQPPEPGDAWIAYRWDFLTGVAPGQYAIDLGAVPSLDTTFIRLEVHDPSGVAIDLDGLAHRNLTFAGVRGTRNTLGSFGATAVLLDHGDQSTGTSASDVVCEALAPGRSFAPCVSGTP
jgi:hypothetical protein